MGLMRLNRIYYFAPFDTFLQSKNTQGERSESKDLKTSKFIIYSSARPECPVRGVSKGLKILLLLTFFTIILGQSNSGLMTFTATDSARYAKEITIAFTVPKKDFLYKDFIACSVDDPTILLSPWKANKQSVAYYDSSFKEAKQVFNEDFTITMTAIAQNQNIDPIYLYCSYYRRSEKKINLALFPLFFTAPEPVIHETIDTTSDIIKDDEPIIKPKKKPSSIELYVFTTFYLIDSIIASLHTDHKKYFALLLFFIMVLVSFFYFFKQELQKQIRIKELLEIIISLLISANTTYLLFYLYAISTPLITMIMASICTAYAGLFYIKKSTELRSGKLRTFCTFIGMLCICSALLLSFKVLQYTDEQFNLL